MSVGTEVRFVGYEVECEWCGVLDYFNRKKEAERYAREHRKEHEEVDRKEQK